MKIIFLDVDGVLAHKGYRNNTTADINPEKVKLLKQICDVTDAKIVVISSWRETRMYQVLMNVLMEYQIPVLGEAPHIPGQFEDALYDENKAYSLEELSSFKLKYGTGRAAEVQEWIQANNPESFVILDDEDWDWDKYEYDQVWIQGSWQCGLLPEHVARAIQILSKGEKVQQPTTKVVGFLA